MRHQHLGLFCFATALAVTLAPLPSSAQTVIQRAGIGRDCFVATLMESTPENNQQGIRTCDRAVDEAASDYDHAAALINRADIRLRIQDYQSAVDDSEKAIALDPKIPVAYLNRGAGLVGLKNYTDAITVLDKAIALNTNKLQLAYYNRGIAKEQLGDIAGAYHDYKMAAEADKNFVLASEQLTRFTVKTR